MNRPPQFAASFISNRQCRPLALLGRADRRHRVRYPGYTCRAARLSARQLMTRSRPYSILLAVLI